MAIVIDGSTSNWRKVGASYTGTQYKLRAGPPMPITSGGFKLHTFKAEVATVETQPCVETLPGSGQFRGQGGNYISANFSRLNIKGGNTFQGRIVKDLDYVEEGSVFTYS